MNPASPDPAPRALILAAGRGRRLAEGGGERPKILLEFGGKTLLQRHIELLDHVGAGPVSIVVGYRREAIEAELARIGRTDDVALIHNPDWREGSVVSLHCAASVLRAGAPVLLMDADVLYDRRLLEMLLRSAHPAALLLDREIEPGDEPVKICVSGARRIIDFAKRPDMPGDWHGESVGFFRFVPEMAQRLANGARDLVESGARAIEYEEPIRALIRSDAQGDAFGFEDVTGLPWTEIDFMEDVEKAQRLLPELAA